MNLFKLCAFACFAFLYLLFPRCSSAQGSWSFTTPSYTIDSSSGFPPSIGCNNTGCGCYLGPGNNSVSVTYTTHLVWSGGGSPSTFPLIYANIRAQGSSVSIAGGSTSAASDVTVKSPFNDLFTSGSGMNGVSYNNPN